jgi:tellurite methyltransferase
VEHDALLRPLAPGRALDVACGDGRNSLHLARLGFEVDALDVSDFAIERLQAAASKRGLPISARAVDLEESPLPVSSYKVAVNFNYLQRDLFPSLERALVPGGIMVFETVAQVHIDELGQEFNPHYVLAPNELLEAFPGLLVHLHREGVVQRGGGARGVAGVVARRPATIPPSIRSTG